ncbi:MAG TPA: CoA-transferase [Deltaproteobacteria bacterium]|nr:CoA-transferase [Deltaproteobacteria bacterium]HQI01311.1 CoA-transferase [Deltaproteobacteria bacterium]
MKNDAPANPLEIFAYIISTQIKDHTIVYVGTGLPMVAGILARNTHAPNITMVYESGGQDPIQGGMPWSVGGPFTWRKSPIIQEMAYSFGQCYNGYVDIAFLGFAQVDMYGNVNTHMIGSDFHNPKARLTGSGGNNDLTSLTENMVLVGLQTPDKFPERVDFITSVGHLRGGNSRKEAGLLGNGPVAVISQCGVFDFEPVSKRMRVKSLHPGMTFEIAQSCTGFELLKPEGEIPMTPMPSPEIIHTLRTKVDPRGVFTSLPTA